MFRTAGIRCLVLSTETNAVVSKRCQKLGLECIQGSKDKLAAFELLCRELHLDVNSTWYVGNDINDLGAMKVAGRAICPSDAHPSIRAISHTVLSVPGGGGVARAIAEDILGLTL
jgi:YrbI family 3-deoxy-D-manno-octulosonate 8-phosphate phosphatase